MNKKILSALAAGVAFVAMSNAASAAECNLGENVRVVTTPKALGAVSAAQPAEIVARLYRDNDYSSVKATCSQEQVLAAFVRINGSTPIDLEQSFKIPVLIAAAPVAASTAQAKPVTVSVPVVQPVPVATASAVAPVPSPRLAAVRVQRTAAEKELQVVRAKNDALPAGLQGLAAGRIEALEQKVNDLKTLEERLTKAEGAITDLQAADDKQNIAIAKAGNDASVALDTANKAKAAAEAAGGLAWYWKALMGISVLLSAIALAVVFFRKPDLSDYATNEDLDGVNAKVEAVKNRFEHNVDRIEGETPPPAELKSLPDNAVFRYPVRVDGVDVVFSGTVVQHSPAGEAIVKVDELSKPVPASKLFKALADYIEHGGAVSTVRAVNT